MAATVLIDIDCGSDFSHTFELARLAPGANVTNATPTATMALEFGSNTTVSFGASLVGSNLTITLSANVSSPLVTDSEQTWVYDAKLSYANGSVLRVVEGRVHLHPEA
jgi:hypothetical protein